MHPTKRIEIIANSLELDKIIDGLARAGVPGYTVIRNVVGKGDRRTASDDLEMTMLSNIYVIAFCSEEFVKSVEKEIVPILNRFGGVCYVSEAVEIRQVKCVTSS